MKLILPCRDQSCECQPSILADLNGLKITNDSLGHQAGNKPDLPRNSCLVNDQFDQAVIAGIRDDQISVAVHDNSLRLVYSARQNRIPSCYCGN